MYVYVHVHVDLDPASWAALVAQLVRASVRSAECRGFKSQLIFIFSLPQVSVCLSVFLSFFLSISSVIMYMYIKYIVHVPNYGNFFQ